MAAILDQIRAAGITLSVDGGNLVARPRAAITDELRVLIRANKIGLMADSSRTTRLRPFASTSASNPKRARLRSCVAAIAPRSLPTPSAMAQALALVRLKEKGHGREGGGRRGRHCGRGRSGAAVVTRELDYMYACMYASVSRRYPRTQLD